MGVSDVPQRLEYEGVPQEIVCVVYSADPTRVESMIQSLREVGFSEERVVAGWDTWRGVTFAPPTDFPPWKESEFQQIAILLSKHKNTILVDTTPGRGSAG